MASNVIGSLRVNLGLDSAQFERGAKKTQPALSGMKAGFLAVGAAAAAMATAIGAMARKGAADIDAAAKSARRLDASIGAFRGLELAADEAGVSLSSLTDDIQTMNRELAKGGTGVEQALAKLGLTASQLAAMDVDEKVATIADRIQDLGLSAGEATAILQQFGIRNREMVLLLAGGGDAIREASADIEDYGLAISQVDAEGIEQANDQISRLGLISQYAGQQLALVLYPALGRMAEAMTDSLREGGFLRAVIDGLVAVVNTFASAVEILSENLDVLAISFGVLASTQIPAMIAGLTRIAFALTSYSALAAYSAAASYALAAAMRVIPFVAVVAGLTLAYRWYRSNTQASRDAAKATDLAAEANRAMRSTLDGVAQGLEQTEANLKALSRTETMLALNSAAERASEAFDQVSVDIFNLMRANMDLGRSSVEVQTQFSRLVSAVRDGSVSMETLRREMDGIGVAVPELAPFVAQLIQSIDASNDASASAERLAALMRFLQGEATDADMALIGAGNNAARLADTADTVNFDKARTSAQALAAQLGVSVALAQQLQGIEARAAGDVVFDPRDPRYDAGAALRARSALGIGQETVSPFDRIARALDGGGSSGGGVSGAASSAADEIRKVTENIIESGAASIAAAEQAKEYSDTMTGFVTDGINRAVDWMVDGFKGGLSSLKDMFVATIKQMIAFAIKNRIMISLGMGGSVAGSAAMAGGAAGIGAAVTAAGGIAGLGGAFAGGVSSFVAGGTAAIGTAITGVGTATAAVAAGTAAAGTGLTAVAAAAGAVALPLLAVAAVFSLLNRRARRQKAAAEAAARAEEALRLAREQAAAVAAAIADERYGLEGRLLALQGNTVELRARELALLNPANHELQQLIFSLEDMQAATTAAAEAQQRVTDERLGLEGRLLALQGNTVELRRREIEGLDASNRGLQQMIWGLEDAKAAMDALDPARFASLFDFRVAQGRLASGSPIANNNAPIFSPQLTGSSVTGVSGVDDNRALLINIEKHTRDTANILQKNDVIGPLPARSVA